jgi:hypothetical protein
VQPIGLVHLAPDGFRKLKSGGFFWYILQQNGEFIAAYTREKVTHILGVFRQNLFDPAGSGNQNFIAGIMAKTVIDDFESIEIDQKDADKSRRSNDRLRERFLELSTVGEISERIMPRFISQKSLAVAPFQCSAKLEADLNQKVDEFLVDRAFGKRIKNKDGADF